MSYTIYIEGQKGAHRVRRGVIPRRGEWLNLKEGGECWWFPVLEVAHVLTEEVELVGPESGCDFVHARAETIVLSTLALGVRAEGDLIGASYKFVVPPTRWFFGGRDGDDEIPETEEQDRNCAGARGLSRQENQGAKP